MNGKFVQRIFIGFLVPLSFHKNIKEGYITLKKAEEKRKEFKSDINEIVKAGKKSEEQKSSVKNVKTFYESREKVIKMFDDYSKIVSEAKYKTIYGEGLKILTPKQMLQRFPIALAQVKVGDTSENLLNEIRQMIYSLCIMKFNRMDTIHMNSENSKTSDRYRLLLNLLDKINLRISNKYVALSNLSI